MLRKSLFVPLALAAALSAADARAYVRTMSDGGMPLFWNGANFGVAVNPTNSSGMSAAQIQQQLQSAFDSWKNAGANMSYGYSQSSGYPAGSGNDGANRVYFASASGQQMGYGVIAVTEVLYYVSSGQVAEFDMAFNDNQFLFTNVEGDTGKSSGYKTKIFLQDVATHEFGHALGFDHSTVGRSTMIYTAFSGQFVLGNDDFSAIRTVYPAAGGNGAIHGTVRGTGGGIFGTHVVAINLASGEVQAGTLANPDGTFRIGDIPPGNYAVMMEPFAADVSSVSAYYQNVNHRFCSYSNFRRTFYSACGSGIATTVGVNGGSTTEIGTLSPSCSQMGNPGGAGGSVAAAKDIPGNGGARFGTIGYSSAHYYRVRNVSGTITARAASYSLFAPVDVKVEILNASGGAVAGAVSVDNVEDPMRGGYTNYDSRAYANNLTHGDYIIKVSASGSRIPTGSFPAGFELADSSNHYLLMVGVNGDYGTPSVTDMNACVSVNNVAQSASYRAPASTPSQSSGGGCGSAGAFMDMNGGGGPGGPFVGSSLSLILMAAALSRLLRAKLARK